METQTTGEQVRERKRRSFYWLQDNFYPQWETVYKSYKCERDPEKDEDGKDDPTQTSVGMPDTFAAVRRLVARGTAQAPHIRYRANDPELGEMISRSIMYQWDRAKVQRQQKKHFTQAGLCGWSVRPWYWASEKYSRSRRVNPLDPAIGPEVLKSIADTYGIPVQFLTAPNGEGELARANLLAQHSRGNLLPVKYDYTAYEGPKCDFLFIGDCYPEPNFQSLQSSNWFIVERRRNLEWLKKLVERYPEMTGGVKKLLETFPDGTSPLQYYGTRDAQNLRQRLLNAIERTVDESNYSSSVSISQEWSITEMHTPGPGGRLTFLGQDDVEMGSIPSPYDLDGRIPFTDLVLIDDLLCGIGDANARIMRGLQQIHDRLSNTRVDLVYNLSRPLMGTTDEELYENPGLLKRLSGLRLVKFRHQGDLWTQPEQAAMAAVAVALQDDSAMQREIQKLTGETNMTQSANVDPAQGRTATGARLMAYTGDILSKDVIDMFTMTSLVEDAEMMYLMNRSELADGFTFDASLYNRQFPSDQDLLKNQFIKIDPLMFQVDGEITVETGSTLADDDEDKITKAQILFSAAMSRPDLFNQEKARDEFLIAHGKAKELAAWKAAPPPPPHPPEMKPSFSLQAKITDLPEELRIPALALVGITAPEPQQGAPGGPMPLGPPPAGGPAFQLPPAPPEEPLIGASAFAAAKGHSPLQNGMPQ